MENMHTDVRVLRAEGVTTSLRKVKQTTEATATRKKNIILSFNRRFLGVTVLIALSPGERKSGKNVREGF